MNKTARILTDSAALLLKNVQRTLEDAGAAIIKPARNERASLAEDEANTIQQMQAIQSKLREVEFMFGDLR